MKLLTKLLGRKSQDAVMWLEVDELSALLNDLSPPLVIDVRGPDEFDGPLGHIYSSQNIPLDQLSAHASSLLAQGRLLVMVCHTDRRSAAAAARIKQVGGNNVAILRGGMVSWRSRGKV